MECSEDGDEEMEENPDEEEQSPSTLVNHPKIPFLAPGAGRVRRDLRGRGGVCPLEALQTSTLGLVALQVARLVPPQRDVGHVWVLL